jgi:hypothetical protein
MEGCTPGITTLVCSVAFGSVSYAWCVESVIRGVMGMLERRWLC